MRGWLARVGAGPASSRSTGKRQATNVRVAVIGAGVMGLATGWALRRRGLEPVVYEQFEIGNPHGSSHGRSRIFRLAYAEDEYVRLAQEALGLWRDLEAASGETLLELNGLVEVVRPLDVKVTRETLCYFHPDTDGRPVPSLVSFKPDRHTHDMYSLADPKYGLKVGAHHEGPEADPNVPGEPEPELVERIAAWA